MSYGFKAYNGNNELAIDDRYSAMVYDRDVVANRLTSDNYFLSPGGTAEMAEFVVGHSAQEIPFFDWTWSNSYSTAITMHNFLRQPGDRIACNVGRYGGGYIPYMGATPPYSASSLTFKIARAAAQVDYSGLTETHGIRVSNSAGNPVFDSRVDYFILRGCATITPPSTLWTSTNSNGTNASPTGGYPFTIPNAGQYVALSGLGVADMWNGFNYQRCGFSLGRRSQNDFWVGGERMWGVLSKFNGNFRSGTVHILTADLVTI